MPYETLECIFPTASLLVITLKRPDYRNALNTRMAEELFDVINAQLHSGDVRCAILTGAGTAFCAGGDLKQRDGMSDQDWFDQHIVFERMFAALINTPIPVIAAVNGPAFGGGCELALACDFIYASKNASFCFPEVGIGIIPGGGGTQTLQRAIGVRRAREMILVGARVGADEALEWGLVNRLFESHTLVGEAVAAGRRIASQPPIAVRQARRALAKGQEFGLSAGLAFEIEAYSRTVVTRDRREGIRAALEKRPGQFKGC